jgi:hypothetical protein
MDRLGTIVSGRLWLSVKVSQERCRRRDATGLSLSALVDQSPVVLSSLSLALSQILLHLVRSTSLPLCLSNRRSSVVLVCRGERRLWREPVAESEVEPVEPLLCLGPPSFGWG